MSLMLHVPSKSGALVGMIRPGSAIVSDGEIRDGRVLVHYEGNAHGASNLDEYHGRMVSAAGRLVRDYPTTAKMSVPVSDLVDVAVLDGDRCVVVEIVDAEALEAWSGETVASIAGAKVEPGRHEKIDDPDYLNTLSQVGRDREGFLYRSRSGQVVAADGNGMTVFEHDDPAIADRLRVLLDDDRLKWVVGSGEPDPGPAPRG